MTGRRSWRRADARALALAGVVVAAAACGAARATVLVVYSPLPEPVLEEVEDLAEAAWTEVDLRFVRLDDATALDRIRAGAGQGDVWWGARPMTLDTAAALGLLAPPPAASEAEDTEAMRPWEVALASPYVFVFNRERTPLGRAPRDWVDLRHPRWRGEVVMVDPERDPDAAWLVVATLHHWSEELGDTLAAWDRLLQLDAVTARYLPDAEAALRAVRVGDASVAVLPQAVAEAARHDGADWIYYRHPETGAPAAVRGVAVLAGAPEPAWAARFVELAAGAGVEAVTRATWWLGADGALPDPDGAEGEDGGPDFLPGSPRLWTVDAHAVAGRLPAVLERWSLEVRGRGRELY